jgi:hypothetical protein
MKPNKLALFLRWLIVNLVGASIGFAIYLKMKAEDCRPGQIDGQCGLSTFTGFVFGAGVVLATLLGSTIWALLVEYRQRKAVAGTHG